MWFTFAIIALLCWSGSDLFSKIGCQDAEDKYSHLKMVMAVGVVMGLHAAWEIFFKGVEVNAHVFLTYLPVSALYILSMAIGYLGLRYIELSISSPICNSSGALVAVLTLITVGVGDDLPPVALVAGQRGRGAARETPGGLEPPLRQELDRPRDPRGLLSARRAGHLCRQPRARGPRRGERELRL